MTDIMCFEFNFDFLSVIWWIIFEGVQLWVCFGCRGMSKDSYREVARRLEGFQEVYLYGKVSEREWENPEKSGLSPNEGVGGQRG